MDLKEQILLALGLDSKVKLEWQAKSDDGATIFVSTADELAVGVDVAVLTEDGTTILLPIGTYKTEEGVTFRVDEEGIVAEVLETETEEEVAEEGAPVEEEMSEEVKEEELADVEIGDWEGLNKRISNLEDAIADLKGEEKDTEEEVEEMSEEVIEPSTNPKSIKTTEVVEFSADTTLEDLQAENERLKTELAAQPASAPLDTNKFSSEKVSLSKKQLKGMTQQDRFFHNLNN